MEVEAGSTHYLPFFILATFSFLFFTCLGTLVRRFSRWASFTIFFLSWKETWQDVMSGTQHFDLWLVAAAILLLITWQFPVLRKTVWTKFSEEQPALLLCASCLFIALYVCLLFTPPARITTSNNWPCVCTCATKLHMQEVNTVGVNNTEEEHIQEDFHTSQTQPLILFKCHLSSASLLFTVCRQTH